ncbi:unnamed protein product [Rhodiola kirilowii]
MARYARIYSLILVFLLLVVTLEPLGGTARNLLQDEPGTDDYRQKKIPGLRSKSPHAPSFSPPSPVTPPHMPFAYSCSGIHRGCPKPVP